MKRLALLPLLLCASSALATITNLQSIGNWNPCSSGYTGNTVNCTVTLSATGNTHLLAVWAVWETNFPYTAAASDPPPGGANNYWYSAVGPTTQPVQASGYPASAQIFYAKGITGSSPGTETITVQFSCLWNPTTLVGNPACTTSPSLNFVGLVAVEYSGLDENDPLDTFSAGYSASASNFLDSGNAAPANTNLLLFGVGFADNGSGLVAGSGFSSFQSKTVTGSYSAIAEDNSSAITSNNVMQRATACIVSCAVLSPTNGDWLMQTAIFRAATSGSIPAVQGGWTPVRPFQVLDATQFPGAPDLGAQINNAYAALPPTGGQIVVSGAGPYTIGTPITFTTWNKPALLTCTNEMATLTYNSSSGAAITLDWGGLKSIPPVGASQAYGGVVGCNLVGANATGETSVGIMLGTSNNTGTVGTLIQNNMITGFNYGMQLPSVAGTFLLTSRNNWYGLNLTAGVDLAGTSENLSFQSDCFCENIGVPHGQSNLGWGLIIESGAQITSLGLLNDSFDTNGNVESNIHYGGGLMSNGHAEMRGNANHFEDNKSSDNYISITSGTYEGTSDSFTIDRTSGSITQLINVAAGTVMLHGVSVGPTAGETVTEFITLGAGAVAHLTDPFVDSSGNIQAVINTGTGTFWQQQSNPGYTPGPLNNYVEYYQNAGTLEYSLDKSGNVYFAGNATENAFTSTVATGTAPIAVSSTTPVANLTVANHPLVYEGPASGALATDELQYWDTAAGAGGAVTYTFKGTFTYTGASTFGCVCTDQSTQTACQASPGTANTVSLTAASGDTVFIFCTGH